MSAIWNHPSWPTLVVAGADAATWLNGILTCEVATLLPGQGRWGSLLSKQGKIQADLQVVGTRERVLLGISGGDAAELLTTLDGYLVMEDAEISSSDEEWVLVAGPEGDEEMRALSLVPHSLPWGGVPVWAATVTQQQLQDIPARLFEQSDDSWRELRVRCGWFRFGTDYDSSQNPHAASLERRTVDWQKGCYLGQEVVCMQDMRGKVKRRLVVLEAETGHTPPPAAGLFEQPDGSSGTAVGRVTSAFGRWAIAQVATPLDAPGTVLYCAGEALSVVDSTKSFPAQAALVR